MNKLTRSACWSLGVGLMSASLLGLEIALTSVYGVLLQYHYVSLVVSLAVFGIGAGAFAAYRTKPRAAAGGKRRAGQAAADADLSTAGWVSAAAGLFIALLSFALAKFPYVHQLALYALLGTIPFALFGWVMGKALGSGAASAPRIYAADLLGASLGALLGYALLERFGGFAAVFALSAPCFAAGAVLFLAPGAANAEAGDGMHAEARGAGAGYSPRKRLRSIGGLALAIIAGAIVWPASSADVWRLDYAGMRGAAPDKTIVGTLAADPASRILRTDWDSFARTDAVATSDDRRRIMFVDGGAGSYMYKFGGDLSQMGELARDIEFLPFAAGKADKAIIVGAGGGRDILYALMAGAKDITAVELSPGLVSAVRSMADYNGGILDRPGVHTVVGDGRGVLERSGESYDLIVLDLVYSQVGGVGGQALSENYAFTREAFRTYLERLTPDGRIIVISHQGIEGLRAYYTGFDALMRAGGGVPPREAAKHTTLLLAPEGSSAPDLTLSVIQKSPLAAGQLDLLRAGARSLGLQALFLPGSDEQLLRPLLDGRTPFDAFVRDSEYKVYPTTDDKPFFFLVEESLPAALRQWLIAIAALTLSFFLLVWRYGAPAGGPGKRLGAWAYYGLIGIGYMSIQTVWIQKSLAYSGTPALAALIVIVPMLLGGTLGSRLAGRRAVKPLAAAVAVIALTAGLLALQAAAGDGLMALGQGGRLAVIGTVMFVYGVVLGIPLPAGLQSEDRRVPGSAPFYFALNGIAGVWGSWLAVAASIASGLSAALIMGCACYALLAVTRYRTT
ncbi:spermidine synthase family protein [Paenibacillus glycinis]|uniref:Spermidine synthase n=1 Tax=Paenibacillus glycinis TaxID=2697035 RepID=A0ABW9XVR2_9BACL|nr:class I SAM-dependent methyltransferase [Paenibacillus glycinis]NBD26784.1 hypothetical protein [Paenibacillus glycinis]